MNMKNKETNKIHIIEMATYPGMLEEYEGHKSDKTWLVGGYKDRKLYQLTV